MEAARLSLARGDYIAALAAFRDLQERDAEDLNIVLELADAYIVQGYINRASQLLEKIPPHALHDKTPPVLAIELLQCFLEAWESARFGSAVERAKSIAETFQSEYTKWSNKQHQRAAAFLTLYTVKFKQVLSVLHAYADAAKLPDLEVLLLEQFTTSRNDPTEDQSFLCLRIAKTLSDQPQKLRMLHLLGNDTSLPGLVRGKAKMEICRLSTRSNGISRVLAADEAIKLLNGEHKHEVLDMEFEDALDDLRDPATTTTTDWNSYLHRYEAMNYPNGLRSALHMLLGVCQDIFAWDAQFEIEERVKTLNQGTGLYIHWLAGQVNSLARQKLRSGSDDMVRENIELLWPVLDKSDLVWQKGQASYFMVEIHLALGEEQQAAHWLAKCEESWTICDEAARSGLKMQRFRLDALRFDNGTRTDVEGFVADVKSHAQADFANGLMENGMHKFGLLISWYLGRKGMSKADKIAALSPLFDELEQALEADGTPDKTLFLAKFYQDKANRLLMLSQGEDHVDFEAQASDALTEALRLVTQANTGTLTFQLIIIVQQKGLVSHALYTKRRRVGDANAWQDFDNAMQAFSACVESFKSIGTSAQLAEAKYWLALMSFEGFQAQRGDAGVTLGLLREAEEAYDLLRVDFSASQGLDAVKRKRFRSGDKHVRDIYRFAVEVCSATRDTISLWQWIQKAKARSLSDVLGGSSLVPKYLVDQLDSDPEVTKEYVKEKVLLAEIARKDPTTSLLKRQELRDLRKSFDANPLLKSLRDLQQGSAVTLDDLRTETDRMPSTHGTERDTVFVDWYEHGGLLRILIVSKSQAPVVNIVNMSVSEVQKWTRTYLEDVKAAAQWMETLDTKRNHPLRLLDPLIEWISAFSKPGDLLVLSPSSAVAHLPLHALWVPAHTPGYKPMTARLIQRNPVVYSASLTTYFQCCRKAASRRRARDDEPIFSAIGLYEPDAIPGMSPEDFDEAERDSIHAYVEQLVADMKGSRLTGQEATISRLKETWPTASIIHFHGHCVYSSEEITDQALILSSGDGTNETRLRLQDAFDLSLESPHMTTLACNSASQQMASGDEPLGLLTALLCAGAASIVGTLWPVKSSAARKFSNLFYAAFPSPKQEKTGDSMEDFVDLAVAVQNATMKMIKSQETGKPWHWAPYVLYGSWFYKD